MRERFVGISHTVRVFTFLNRVTAIVRGVEEFIRQAIRHCIFGPGPGGFDYPANGQRLTAIIADLTGT